MNKNMCVFCKIVNNEIPYYKVYEDDKTLAFLDISPINHGHTLVISKNHYANLNEIPADELANLIVVVKKVSSLLSTKLNFSDYTISENNGIFSGQSVFHIHFHVIPRYEDDNLTAWEHKEYAPGEAEEIIKKLVN
jgi:histidine triad (HIT) family protein